jgi:hypothetical protein
MKTAKELSKIAELISGMEGNLDGYLDPSLIKQLTEARWAVEEVRDSMESLASI